MSCPTITALLVRPLIIHNGLRENESAYDRYMIRPRVLRDLSKLDTSTSIVGCKVKFPFGFSPTAMQTLAHPDGEEGTSKACAKLNTLMGLSNYSTKELEKVISHSTGNPYVMQMSLLKNKKAMIQMIKRAEGEAFLSD
jgi:L-lactate dehydrogenase (FMN-dependent) and related alpha-hydroxy acid dehydrogenases